MSVPFKVAPSEFAKTIRNLRTGDHITDEELQNFIVVASFLQKIVQFTPEFYLFDHTLNLFLYQAKTYAFTREIDYTIFVWD